MHLRFHLYVYSFVSTFCNQCQCKSEMSCCRTFSLEHRYRLSFEMNFLVTEKFSLVCFFSSQDENFL